MTGSISIERAFNVRGIVIGAAGVVVTAGRVNQVNGLQADFEPPVAQFYACIEIREQGGLERRQRRNKRILQIDFRVVPVHPRHTAGKAKTNGYVLA